MGNINYFCTVKRLKNISEWVVICLISLICSEIHASVSGTAGTADSDSISISLLTCSPGTEVYSLYGHTAIRYTDYGKGIDVAVNYGVFSFGKPFFIVRFIFGLTDYEMGIMPFDYFCEEYRSEGRSVCQQELNLTTEEKLAIRQALENNNLPQNRVYRYNYFYDNCTTRARDILTDNIRGKVEYTNAKPGYASFRRLIHRFNEDYPWMRFGNDLLLGVKADKRTDLKEHQFLPMFLMNDFDSAMIDRGNGEKVPLVLQNRNIIDCSWYVAERGFPLRPRACAWIVFAITLCVTVAGAILGKRLWGFDTAWMILDGCVGLVIFMMFFSEHPTTSTNLQIFLFNPLPLFFIFRAAKRARKKLADPFWKYAAMSLMIFFICGFFQQYAEGMYILASSLLLRCAWNMIYQRKYLSGK